MSIPVTDTNEYKQLTKILEVLEQQREQVIKDKEIIQSAYEEAIKSPIEYIESLIEGKIKLPTKIIIAKVPEFSVSLPKYNNSGNNSSGNGGKRFTRSSSSQSSITSSPPTFISSLETKTKSNPTTTTTTTLTPSVLTRKRRDREKISESEESEEGEETESDNNGYVVSRNRKISMNQEIFYQDSIAGKPPKKRGLNELKSYWTEEEQLKLERLLYEYPEEEIASHRWTKIANELGGRTPSQVASRVQKFFAKLEKLGLKIPGSNSTPKKKSKTNSLSSSDRSDNEQPLSVHKFPHLPKQKEKRQRYEERKLNNLGGSTNNNNNHNHNNNSNSNKQSSTSTLKMLHEGFKCDGCDSEPIVGIRWHCEECPHEVDLCQDCKDKYEEIGSHLSSHHMSSVENPDPYFLDEDYKFSYPSGESNYLDPNYR